MDNFCLPAQKLEHLRFEFYHETGVLKTQDAIFSHCFANIITNKIVKNLRPNGKKIRGVCPNEFTCIPPTLYIFKRNINYFVRLY